MLAPAKNSRQPEPDLASELVFAKAGFLDIPFIFQLLLEGGIAGSFSDRYLIGAGHFKLFLWITDTIAPWPAWLTWRRKTKRAPSIQIVRKGDDDVGLIQMAYSKTSLGVPQTSLVLLAVAQNHKNQRYGTQVIERLIDELPELAVMDVCCTKYARAMHHILHKLHFKRDRVMVKGLSRFVFIRQPALAAAA